MVAIDVFTGKKYEDICPSTHNMNVPNVIRKDYSFVDIEDGFLSLMDETDCVMKNDLMIPDGEVGDDIKKKQETGDGFVVTVMMAMGEEKAVGIKAQKD